MSEETKQTDLVVSTLKAPKCALMPLGTLTEAAETAVAQLRKLADSPDLPAEVRAQVTALVGSANPSKKGLSEDTQTAWQIPEITIRQKSTEMGGTLPDNAKDGFLLSVMNRKTVLEVLPQPFKFHVLAEYSSNVRFTSGEKAPTCSSPDARLGSPNGECAKCPDLPMGQQPGGWNAQKPSSCAYSLCYVVIDAAFTNIYEVKFSKTSFKAGQNIATLIRAGAGNVWQREFQLTTEKQSNDHGTYYTFKSQPTGETKIDADHDKVCDAVADVFLAGRSLFLHRFYAGVLNAKDNAKKGDAAFGSAIGAGLDGNEGTTPNFDTPIDGVDTSANKARNSNNPM